jgi:hypothetical protein
MSEVQTEEQSVPGPMEDYAPPGQRPPLLSYGVAIAIFNALFAGALLLARRRGKQLPERIGAGDILLIGTATHKASRLITKEKITSVVRAPFTRYQGPGGPAEVEEAARGTGLRRTIGELLVCPYCISFWLAAAFSIGLIFSPRLTRFIAATLSAVTASDFLQVAYKTAEERGLKGS